MTVIYFSACLLTMSHNLFGLESWIYDVAVSLSLVFSLYFMCSFSVFILFVVSVDVLLSAVEKNLFTLLAFVCDTNREKQFGASIKSTTLFTTDAL